ncbi:MAG: hypothetical protein GY702_28860, partial [Desulfobulbaceae bacterium]|nr:hypothetical protein [Desulfobulbaceae bacterium]
MANIIARSNNRRDFDSAMEGVRSEMLHTFDSCEENWGQHQETLLRGLEKKARVLFPNPAGLLTRSPERGLREMDDVSVANSECDLGIAKQGVTPLYASTPGEQCNVIAPGNERWGMNERSHHSVQSNERFIAGYDAENSARELSSPPEDQGQEP